MIILFLSIAYTVGVNFNSQNFVVFISINRYEFLLLVLIVLRGLSSEKITPKV